MKNVPQSSDSRMGVGEVIYQQTQVKVRRTVRALVRSLRNSGVRNYGVIRIPDYQNQDFPAFRIWSHTNTRFVKGLPERFQDVQLA